MPYDYDGGMTEHDLVNWVILHTTEEGKSLEVSAELLSIEAAKAKRALIYVGPEDAPHF